jgi:hypothetical protein
MSVIISTSIFKKHHDEYIIKKMIENMFAAFAEGNEDYHKLQNKLNFLTGIKDSLNFE